MTRSHDFWVTLHGERGDWFERHVGTRRFPALAPVPTPVRLPVGVRPCYLLAVEAMDEGNLGALAAAIAARHGGTAAEVYQALVEDGMPILDEDVSVAVHNPQRWFG